jgi:selenoprotein W-related protein
VSEEEAGGQARPGRATRVEIVYCTRCRFLPRAAWLAQELLTTFAEELGEVALVPGDGGVFQVFAGGERLWCRKEESGFPELAELKRRLRDRVAPGKPLGHSDA